MRRAFFLVLALVWGTTSVAEVRVTGSEGLPVEIVNEVDLYAWHPDTGKFYFVPEGRAKPEHLYVRWVLKYQTYLWVTGADRRIILQGSKVQGWRLGLPGQRGLNWFKLVTAANWQKVTDRKRPEVWRETEDGRVIKTESLPDEWVTWGGELDPLPGVAPTCRIIASASSARPGDAVRFRLEIAGDATSAEIAGQSVQLVDPWRELFAPSSGPWRVTGKVSGPAGSSTCETSVALQVPSNPPTCRLIASASQARPGDAVRFRLEISGQATIAEIAGVSVPLELPYRELTAPSTGPWRVSGKVTGDGGSSECSAEVAVQVQQGTPPSCRLTATPSQIRLGEWTTVILETSGTVTSATLEGEPIPFPRGERRMKPSFAGMSFYTAKVSGPAGEATCRATIDVAPVQ